METELRIEALAKAVELTARVGGDWEQTLEVAEKLLAFLLGSKD